MFGWQGNKMVSAAGSTTVVDFRSGEVRAGATAAYYGRPVLGFAGQSFVNGRITGGSGVSLANYGGQFNHKIGRRIEVLP